jgi:hypothetical protein
MEGDNARRPPPDWEPVIATLSRRHAQELREYAVQLERVAGELEQSEGENP